MKNTIEETQEGLRIKEFSCVELVEEYLSRIDTLDKKINAFITITKEEALKKAKWVDETITKESDSAFEKFPLLGVPYTSKDNYSTKNIKTTAGSKILDNYIPPFDATAIKKLNKAGAVMLGKVNMDAFAHGASTENSDFFTTKNPWDTTKVPGGSSGGSAAAVISDMCLFATASETGGSTRGPSSWCGVTGMKPTYGRVSRYGIVAMASSTDSPGPITRNAEDNALVLKVMAGKDPFDATSSPKEVPNYLDSAKKYNLKGVRIGKPKSYFESGVDDEIITKVEEALKEFEKLGATIVDIDLLDPKYSIAVYTILQRSEVSSNLSRLSGVRYGNPRSTFGLEAKKRIMLGTYALSSGHYDAYYAKAQRVRTLIVEDFNKDLEKVDLIIGPTMPCTPPSIGESGKDPMYAEVIDALNEPSCIAGLPGVNVPCGFIDSLPVGFQIIGKMFDEVSLLGAALKYQEVTDFHKRKPKV